MQQDPFGCDAMGANASQDAQVGGDKRTLTPEQLTACLQALRAGHTDEAVLLLQGVEMLNLNDQSLRGEAVRTLGAALRLNSSVIVLQLSHTQLDGADAAAILDALHSRSVQVRVSLSDNALGDQDCVALGAAIARNGTVTQLYFTNNSIDVAGMVALRAGIERNTVLTDVVFAFRGLSDSEVVDGNPFHSFDEGLEHEFQINTACRENRQQRNGRGMLDKPADERVKKLGVFPEADISKMVKLNHRTSLSACVLA
jgi:hypothetical protein